MKIRITNIVYATAALVVAAGAATLQAGTETREVERFDRVAFNVPGELVLVRGETPGVQVEADEDDLKHVRVSVKGGRLSLDWAGSGWFGWGQGAGDNIRIVVTAPALRGVEVAGSGRVTGGSWAAETFTVELNGSGDATFDALAVAHLNLQLAGSGDIRIEDVDAPVAEVELMGSGDVVLAGSAVRLDVQVMGSGDVQARELQGTDVAVQVVGSGNVQVWATDTLNARVMGSGGVRYRGSPKVEHEEHGSGQVAAL